MTTATQTNPYAATYAQQPFQAQVASRSYRGIRRLTYFGMTFMIGVTFSIVMMSVEAYVQRTAGRGQVVDTDMLGFISVVCWIAYLWTGLYLCGQRLVNIGYSSAWLAFTALIPIYGFFVCARCLVCPEGYNDHKQLDMPGKIVMGLMVAAIFLPFLLLLAVGIIGVAAV